MRGHASDVTGSLQLTRMHVQVSVLNGALLQLQPLLPVLFGLVAVALSRRLLLAARGSKTEDRERGDGDAGSGEDTEPLATVQPAGAHCAAQQAHDAWLARAEVEPVLSPHMPIVDAHHHLWPQHPTRGHVERFMLEELEDDICSCTGRHRVVQTVYMQSSSTGWRRGRGPDALRPVAESTLCQRVAERSAQRLVSSTRKGHAGALVNAGIQATVDMTLDIDDVEAALDEHLRCAKNVRGVRHVLPLPPCRLPSRSALGPTLRFVHPSPRPVRPIPCGQRFLLLLTLPTVSMTISS